MERKKKIDYQAPSHRNYDHEFAYELGAEMMDDQMSRKNAYLNQLDQRNSTDFESGVDRSRDNLQSAFEEMEVEIADEFEEDTQVFNSSNFYNRHHYAQNELRQNHNDDQNEENE